ncbi:phytanoyl-CoA dioxygenase [Hyaloraphidium curvatum]|nr:phytanoyl-CoA dioxygenase [Hyaloraphidium curvatum]
MFLKPEELHQFAEEGYTVREGFLTPEECAELRDEIRHLIATRLDLNTHPGTSFSTGAGQSSDEYFLSSGDKIRFFLEKGAVVDGKLSVSKIEDSVNKIGHALAQLDPVFRKVTSRPELKELAKQVGFSDDVVVVQSMAILKPPRIGGEVVPHQDSTFLYTDPPSAVGVWIPLEDCTQQNGCLWFAPCTHKTHRVSKRFVRDPTKIGTIFVDIDEPNPEVPNEAYIPVECKAGSLVLIHGSAVHKSEHNYSDKTRYAYTFHLLEGKNAYPKDNWLQNEGGAPFTRLLQLTA